ncbi:MAG: hypothetical protein AAF724_01895 [Pseudomonadota bacterium]
MSDLDIQNSNPLSAQPILEMGAYEALWLDKLTSFKKLADLFRDNPSARPSDFVSHETARQTAAAVRNKLASAGVEHFGVGINGIADYPERLRDADNPSMRRRAQSACATLKTSSRC